MATADIIYNRDFNLECWPLIKAMSMTLDPIIPRETSVMYVDFKKHAKNVLIKLEEEMSDKLGRETKLNNALLFKSKPFAEPVIHHDVMDQENISTVALNVPIYNTEGSFMEWWDGEYNPFILYTDNTRKVKHVHLEWKSDPVLLNRVEILRPAFVRIDIPHRAVNPQDRNRMMMSLRFSPDLPMDF